MTSREATASEDNTIHERGRFSASSVQVVVSSTSRTIAKELIAAEPICEATR